MEMELIIAATLSLLPPLAVAGTSWVDEKNIESKKKSFLQQGKNEIEFLSACMEFYDQHGSEVELEKIKRETTLKLNRLMSQLDKFQVAEVERKQNEEEISFFRRAFLFYKPTNRAGWVWRILFYLFVGSFLLFSIAIISDQTALPDLAFAVFAIVMTLILVGIPMLIFRSLSIRADKRGRKESQLVENKMTNLAS